MLVIITGCCHHIPMRACIFPDFEGSHGLFIVSSIAHNMQEFSVFNWGGITSKNFDEYDIMICMLTKQQPALTSDDAAVLKINNLPLKYEVRLFVRLHIGSQLHTLLQVITNVSLNWHNAQTCAIEKKSLISLSPLKSELGAFEVCSVCCSLHPSFLYI